MKKIDIGQNAKVVIKWNTSQPVITKEEEKSMIATFAKKYGISPKRIRIEKNYIAPNGNMFLVGDVVQDRHDPKFQQELMKQYIQINGIQDIDFDEIIKIDSQINALVDYDAYGKSKKYTIKWVKWSNFLSYGPDNYFDFTNLHGLVLLNGQPANKSGKSTFAYDLLHFLLFGKTNTNKAGTLGELFNNYLPNENEVKVEGCINIDNEDYIIRRTLTRSNGKKRTVTNKVEYYKLLSDGTEELLPEENQQGATTTQTSKIIKESIGNENDFDLIVSANSKDLDGLINETTESEKGRLLSRWIGLSVIEDKDVKAREKWNKEIRVGRYCDMYNRAKLQEEVDTQTAENEQYGKAINDEKSKIAENDKNIESFKKNRDTLVSAKQTIDDSLLKVDVQTLESTINNIVENGKKKKIELADVEKQITDMGKIEYSEEDYKKLKSESDTLIDKMAEARTTIKHLTTTNTNLANAEFCPTCHRKLDNVDNTATINENKKKIEEFTAEGIKMKKRNDELAKQMSEIEILRAKSTEKSKLELKKAAINVEIAEQRSNYKENKQLLDEVNKNKDAIAKNSKLDAEINVIDVNIKTEENLKYTSNNNISAYEREIAKNNESIALKKSYILKIDEEVKIEKYWKLYLQMIGKDGISKMVLRNTLPIINSELNRILGDSTDFEVEIVMNEKNDINFLMKRDEVITKLSAASGLETTQAALALRVVLGKMSQLSKPPFIFLDEILGTVAEENYDSMKRLYDRISDEYDFILHITHLNSLADWHDSIITVVKENNISRIKER